MSRRSLIPDKKRPLREDDDIDLDRQYSESNRSVPISNENARIHDVETSELENLEDDIAEHNKRRLHTIWCIISCICLFIAVGVIIAVVYLLISTWALFKNNGDESVIQKNGNFTFLANNQTLNNTEIVNTNSSILAPTNSSKLQLEHVNSLNQTERMNGTANLTIPMNVIFSKVPIINGSF